MSVAELQARIDSLSADILRQKEVLRTLELKKCAAQRQLNAVRDPVARLPLEISSEIFIQCLSTRARPGARHAPMILANICNGWADIALSTPSLWAAIDADHPISDLASLLDIWLSRAGCQALSISLPTNLTGNIAAVVARHAHQLQVLNMYHPHDQDDSSFSTAVGSLPFLKNLTIIGIDEFSCSISATFEMLRICSNLVECTLDDVFYGYHGFNPEDILLLPRVRLFNFGTYPEYSSDHILRHITLPDLQTLFISLQDIQLQDLLQFLRRSSPPLQQIIVGDAAGLVDWTLEDLEECLPLLSTLTDFECLKPQNALPSHLLTILATSSHLLPNLSTLTLQLLYPPAQLLYEQLFSALRARRKQLHVVWISWRSKAEARPREDVTVQLRQLVADGMSIHVGPEDRNYI
ncbi:hypothetical protein B0H17DRAFT_100981 [Mycena rosella]|uniref:F-box domain-containing protein n=1 Tax=Mycena rosella TaxID=1033263 RepID=A0AAD7G920_MYCRO|nr:hypothetical protein B0H17DRAFT_100981 [Mycena rosella]